MDTAAIRATLQERADELRAELAVLTKVTRDPSATIGFGKRVGEGTSQAIDRFAEVGVAQELQPIKERIQRALQKLDDGTYGTCDECGKEIAAGRLNAAPESALCIDCAR